MNPHINKHRGFTLMELLVVMVILGMLAALVGPALFGNISKGQVSAAQTQMDSLATALDNYRLDIGGYPRSMEGLVENDTGRDIWGGRRFALRPYAKVLNALDRRDGLFWYFSPWRDPSVRPLAELSLLPVIGFEWRF